MRYRSTNNACPSTSFEAALFAGLAPDGGLYLPETIPTLDHLVRDGFKNASVPEVATEVLAPYLEEIPEDELSRITQESLDFEIPLRPIADNLWILELFHGPTFAFKDVGARVMSRLMSWFLRNDDNPLTVLVATSGDTGSAVAHAFFGLPNLRVVILYPRGKVSPLQEKQFTTLGGNVEALAVEGTFDDCQRMIKEAFANEDLRRSYRLTSANSINVGRLLPQAIYYFWARALLPEGLPDPVFCTPSGNFGNLCAGLIAKKMGLACEGFISATNANDVIPQYLETGVFSPRPSQRTISNAMDVGDPSNFARILDMYDGDIQAIRSDMRGTRHNDDETRAVIGEVYANTGYVLDPHSAVGYLGARSSQEKDRPMVVLATAHPAKFREHVEPIVGHELALPALLADCLARESRAVRIPADLDQLLGILASDPG